MKTVFGPDDRNDLNNEKYLSFMEIKLFVFSVDTFQLFNHDKRNYSRSLRVAFEVENAKSYRIIWLEILQANFFRVKLTKCS